MKKIEVTLEKRSFSGHKKSGGFFSEKEECCSMKERGAKGLFFLGAVFFGALGFAAILEGIMRQIQLGFIFGFVAYILGLLFLGIAKSLKWKACGCCMPLHH